MMTVTGMATPTPAILFKVMTVTGMATPTPAIQVTVSTFDNCNKIQGSRSDDSYRDGDADPHGPCDC